MPLSLSTLADQVGAATAAPMPLYRLIEAHVLAAERLHGDDTTAPVMAKSKTDTGRLWVYVHDDRPFADPAPPAAGPRPAPCWKPAASGMPDASSSNSPTSRARHAGRAAGSMQG